MPRKRRAFSLAVLIGFIVQLILLIETVASQPVGAYYPSGYNLLGATAYVSGATTDLQSNNGVYITSRSYTSQTSAQTLYAHQETTTIADTSYYLLKSESADASGISLSASMTTTGRQLWGKSVYQLTGVTSIPAGTWTIHYRTWHSSVPEVILTNSPSIVPTSSWSSPEDAYSSDDAYAYTDINGQMQPYGNYGFSIPGKAVIAKVEVGYEAYNDEDEKIGITLSWDGRSTWATEYVSPPLGRDDPNNVTWIDFTSATSWTPNKLSNANFYARAKGIMTGSVMDSVFLDWIPVRVTYVESPSAHADVDIMVRKSDGTIRQTLATNVANSVNLTTTAQTLSGVYSWSAYTVVEETDFLEIDYYLDITTTKVGVTAYLRIDDNTLPIGDQTKTTDVMLPSEYMTEAEFTGTSNTNYWSKLVWTVDSAWTIPNVVVTLQIYNYTLGGYPTTANGYIPYTSNATPNTDETKNQTITTNPTHFRDSLGNWKIKVKGVKSTTTQFDFKADLIKLEVTGDTTTPVWSNAGTNNTTPGQSTLFYVKWADNVGLSGFIFGTNNTGKWENDTWTPIGGTSNWSNVTKTLNSTAGIVVQWRVWANDTSTNWNDTGILSLKIPQPSNTPSMMLPYIFLIGIASIGVILGVVWKKKGAGSKFVGFEFFNEIIGGGFPVGSSVLIIGGPASGKSILSQQLAHKYLTEKKACIFISYDNFPSKIRENMKNFGWDLSTYEQEGAFTFTDCYSSLAGTTSQERHSVKEPFALTELSIATSTALEEVTDMPKALFLDSATSLFTNLDASRVIRFLQDRGAKIKASDGIFVFTIGKGTVAPNFINRLEETVDCIIELEVYEEKRKNFRRMRVKKLRGQRHLDEWVMFKIKPNYGLVFLRPKKVK